MDIINEDKEVIQQSKSFQTKKLKTYKTNERLFYKKIQNQKILKEFRVQKTDVYKEGNELGLEIFKDKKFLDVRSKTIGKGAGFEKMEFRRTKSITWCFSIT